MIPVAHVDAFGEDSWVLCPYCGVRLDPGRIPAYPVADLDAERLDADRMSWESRCPNCGGDFSLSRDGPAYRNDQQSVPRMDRRLMELMITLEAMEDFVSTIKSAKCRMTPPGMPGKGIGDGLHGL